MRKASSLGVFPSHNNHSTSRHLALTRAVPLALMVVLLAMPAPARAVLTWANSNAVKWVVFQGFNDEATITNRNCIDWSTVQLVSPSGLNLGYGLSHDHNDSVNEFGGFFHVQGSGSAQKFDVWALVCRGGSSGKPPPSDGLLMAQIRRQLSDDSSGANIDLDIPIVPGSTTNFDASADVDTCWQHARIELPVIWPESNYWFTVSWSPHNEIDTFVMTTSWWLPRDPLVLNYGFGQWIRNSDQFAEPMIVIRQVGVTPIVPSPNELPTVTINAQTAAQNGDTIPVAFSADPKKGPNGLGDDKITSNTWSIVSQPPGGAGSFGDPSASNTTFHVNTNGTFMIQVVVWDKYNGSGSAQHSINVTNLAPPNAVAPWMDPPIVHAMDYTTSIRFTTVDAGPHAIYSWKAIRADTEHTNYFGTSTNSVTATAVEIGLGNVGKRDTATSHIYVTITDTNTHLTATSSFSEYRVSPWPDIWFTVGDNKWGVGEFAFELPVSVKVTARDVRLATAGTGEFVLENENHQVQDRRDQVYAYINPGCSSDYPQALTYEGELVWDNSCITGVPTGPVSKHVTLKVTANGLVDANGFTLDGDDSDLTYMAEVSVPGYKYPLVAIASVDYWLGIAGSLRAAAEFLCPVCSVVEMALQAIHLYEWHEACEAAHVDPPEIDTNFMSVATVSLPQLDTTAAAAPDQTSYLATLAAEQMLRIRAEQQAYDATCGKLFGAYQASSTNGMLLQAPELIRHAAALDGELESCAVNVLAAQQALGVPSRQSVLDMQQRIATSGFPQREVEVLQQLGYNQAQINTLRADIAALDLTTVPIGVPGNIGSLMHAGHGAYTNQAYDLVPGGWALVAATQPRPGEVVHGTITVDAQMVHKKSTSMYCFLGPTLVLGVAVDGNPINVVPYPPPPNGNSYCPPPALPYPQAVPFQLDTTTLSDGPHTITVTVQDKGQQGGDPRYHVNSDTITIYVDNTAPLVTITSGESVNCGESITYEVFDPPVNGYASGVVDPMHGVMSSKVVNSGSVTIRVADRAGNVTTTNVMVTVDDHEPPAIVCPSDITVTLAPGQSNTNLSFSVTAIDNCDPAPQVVCVPASGSAFEVGRTTVNCTATDASANQATNTFTVTVLAAGSWEAWQWQNFGCLGCPQAAADSDPDGDGMSNTNEFLAGFNPTNTAAYLHIISLTIVNSGLDAKVTYLGANGDNSYTGGPTSRTNVLEYTCGTANGSYTNNFASTGQTNILSGGTGFGIITNMVDSGVATNKPARYYHVRVLVP